MPGELSPDPPVRRETSSGHQIQDGKPRVHDSNPDLAYPNCQRGKPYRSRPVTRPDLRGRLSASNHERTFVTGANGPLMARLSSSDLRPHRAQILECHRRLPEQASTPRNR